MGQEITDEDRKCPMCGSANWILLNGISTSRHWQVGYRPIAYSCDECGFMRWHRRDKVES